MDDRELEYARRYRAKDPDAYRARNAAYAREWRAKPENLERARESNRQSRLRAKAADPEGYAERVKARYAKWLAQPGNAELDRERKRAQASGWRKSRRGLTREDQHDYWLARGGLCDLCGLPYEDPILPDAWRGTVVDHEHGHCKSIVGCSGCVRGQGHRVCNVVEGVVAKALALGMLSEVVGPLSEYLADPPMRRWLQHRGTFSER